MLIPIFFVSLVIFIIIIVFTIRPVTKISCSYKLISGRKKAIFVLLILLNLVYIIPTIMGIIETINPSLGSQGWGWVLVPFLILISVICIITTVPLMRDIAEIDRSSFKKNRLGKTVRVGVTFLLACLAILYLVSLLFIFFPRQGVSVQW